MRTMINNGGCNNEAIPPFKGARGMLRQTNKDHCRESPPEGDLGGFQSPL